MISPNVPFIIFVLICTGDIWEPSKGYAPNLSDIMVSSWQKTASMDIDCIFKNIPEDWVLSNEVVEQNKQSRVLTRSFVEGLLDLRTVHFTISNSVNLVGSISNGLLTAAQVTRAICKKSAFAHQTVTNFLISNDNINQALLEQQITRNPVRTGARTHQADGPGFHRRSATN